MKQKIPNWVFIVISVVAVLVIGIFLYQASAGPGDLPAPKIKVRQAIPDHLKGKLSPEQEKLMREQTEKYGEIDPNAPEAPAPSNPSGQ